MPSEKFEEFIQKKQESGEPDKNTPVLDIGETISWADLPEEVGKREWIWENYIAKGHITLLSALWKAGKSVLLRHLFLAIANEEEFAGQPTKRSKIMVLSEETKDEWFDAKEDVDPELIKDVYIKIRPLRVKPNQRQWQVFTKMIADECEKLDIDLVVIDTVSTFWPIDNENDSAQVMKALVPLYEFTERRIAVLIVHHFRKGGGDQAQASRGSGALPGFVDNIIEFTRSEDGMFYDRVLTTYGRFDNVLPKVVIRLTPEGKYITLGEPWKVSKTARLYRIIELLEDTSPMSVKEILNQWTKTDPNIVERSIRRYCKELFDKNILTIEKEETVRSKKTPFYALKPGYKQAADNCYPPREDTCPVLSEPKKLSDGLSAVGQNYVRPKERTGLSVEEKTRFTKEELEAMK